MIATKVEAAIGPPRGHFGWFRRVFIDFVKYFAVPGASFVAPQGPNGYKAPYNRGQDGPHIFRE
jgi:hypothetical protein